MVLRGRLTTMQNPNGLKERDGLGRRFAQVRCEHAIDVQAKAESGEAPVWWVPRDEALEFARQEVLRANLVAKALLEKAERELTAVLDEPTRPLPCGVILPPPPEELSR